MKILRQTIMIVAAVSALIGPATLATVPAAHAQERCALHAAAVKHLEGQFNERAVGRGLADEGHAMVELFTSKGGSWTLVVTGINKRSCIIASGDSWHNPPAAVETPPEVAEGQSSQDTQDRDRL